MKDTPEATRGPDTEPDILAAAWTRLAEFRIPRRENLVWYVVGMLIPFFFVVQALSGILLMVYYVPSVQPLADSDGRPLVRVVVRDVPPDSLAEGYRTGDTLLLPFDTDARQVIIPYGLSDQAFAQIESGTGRPAFLSAAYHSVEYRIMRQVAFGSLLRSIHRHSSNLLLLCLLLHLAGAFFRASWRRRGGRIRWLVLCSLCCLALAMCFTGYLLPWNTLGYFATEIGLSSLENSIPLMGPVLGEMLRGGVGLGEAALQRMHTLHIIVLPMLFSVLLAWYGVAIIRRGRLQSHAERLGRKADSPVIVLALACGLFVSAVLAGAPAHSPLFFAPLLFAAIALALLLSAWAGGTTPEPDKFAGDALWPSGALRLAPALVLAFLLLCCLAIIFPWKPSVMLSEPVDISQALVTPEGIVPDWYFVPAYVLLNLLAAPFGALVLWPLAAAILLYPWLERTFPEAHHKTLRRSIGGSMVLFYTSLILYHGLLLDGAQ